MLLPCLMLCRFDISEIAAPYARNLLLEGQPQFAALQKDFGKRWANQSRAVKNLFTGPNQIEDIAGAQLAAVLCKVTWVTWVIVPQMCRAAWQGRNLSYMLAAKHTVFLPWASDACQRRQAKARMKCSMQVHCCS